MAENYNSKLIELSGTVDGANTVFTTPTRYVANSIRVIWNGQVYDKDDTRHGWSETDDQTVTLTTAPRTGDTMQAFYQDADSEFIYANEAIGSPFDPNGVLP